MDETVETERERLNASRFQPESQEGFYESYFLRANHPTEPTAFWIRYTVFSRRGQAREAVGELWAILFDGSTNQHTALKETFPIGECAFSPSDLQVRIGEASLDNKSLRGAIASGGRRLAWDLRYEGSEPPLLLLPQSYYAGGFPKAKALVGRPLACFSGTLRVDEQILPVNGWVGSQNHNWGARHTDRYAWGQVAGFENNPSAFLECSTAKLKLGPFWTPALTNVVLRLDGKELALNSLRQSIRAHGRYDYFSWKLDTRSQPMRIKIDIHAPRESFVGLRYANPPGGDKACLNTKIATCRVTVEGLEPSPIELVAPRRAAFEILTEDTSHGIHIMA